MKNLIVSFLLLILTFNISFADCDFSTGITPGPNKTFIYSEACHQKVGLLVQQNASLTTQISDLTTALDLKNAALAAADQRTSLWEKTSDDELNRLNTIESDSKHSDWLFFSLGIATTFAAAYTASRIYH